MPDQLVEDPGGAWQERALARSLGKARARALAHSSQFLAAAMELAEETGRLDFTIRNLVDKSKLSTKAFYQHFGSKEDLLLAMYENLISQFVEDLREEVLAPARPLDQLETFCRAYLSRAAQSYTVGGRALTIYHLRLEIDRPADFVKSFEPQLVLLTEVLEACLRAGDIREDLEPSQLALLLSTTLMSLAQTGVLQAEVQHADISGDDVWAWCRGAVGAGTSLTADGSATTSTAPSSAPRQRKSAPAARRTKRSAEADDQPTAGDPGTTKPKPRGRVGVA